MPTSVAARPLRRPGWWSTHHIDRREALALVGVLALAVALRLLGLTNDTDVSDEGIRGLQLRLMAAGYRPVAEIYASQGPLSLYLVYPLYQLFDGGIVAARLAVVVYSLVGILGLYWLGRRLSGPIAGATAVALLAVSPIYLERSRLALVEVPSLAPAVVSLAMLAQYQTTGTRGWLLGSAVLLAVAALAKPMALTAVAAALVLIVWGQGSTRAARWRPGAARLRDVLLYGAVGVAVCGLVVALVGPAQVWDQIVGYRLAARAARGWDLVANLAILREELAREGLGLLLAVAIGAAILLRRRPLEALAVLVWLSAALALLLVYSPLFPKHVVYLLPPLALLGGIGLGEAIAVAAVMPSAARDLASRRRFLAPLGMSRGVSVTKWVRPSAIGAILALAAYLGSLPAVAGQDVRILGREGGEDAERYADDVRVVAAVAGPNDFIVMDDAYLALESGRLVPPFLVDLSLNRILARALTGEQAIAETTRFGARAIVSQDTHLGQLPRYLAWVDREYVLVKSYVQRRPNRFRRVYVRPDADLAAARGALAAAIETPLSADFGPVRLHGYSLERRDPKAGGRLALTMHWEALVGSPPEHHLVVRLRAGDGTPAEESTWRVGDGAQVLETWAAGRWMVQTVRALIDDRTPPGAYTLTLTLQPPGGRPAAIRSEAATLSSGDIELDLGSVQVR